MKKAKGKNNQNVIFLFFAETIIAPVASGYAV